MNDLLLSEAMIARVFWTELRASGCARDAATDINTAVLPHSQEVSKSFTHQTGSISSQAAELIWLLARYFQPKSIAEVGTFIGRSTLALYMGARQTVEFLATCDFSHNTWRAPPTEAGDKIRYFGLTSSTQMFQRLVEENRKIELFLFDGRIAPEDLDLIEQLATPQSVFILDDFEGVEKGVVNALHLREKFKNYLLLAPDASLETGWNASNCLGVMLPASSLRLSRQQRLPLSMM